MIPLSASLRVILIGGTSHVGKSTVAKHLAAAMGWDYTSTDSLARHPGRPWRHDGSDVPPHVVDHFATLGVDELMTDVLNHYAKNVVPQVEALVRARTSDPSTRGLVLEGSALWPEFVAHLIFDHVAAVWLTASAEVLTRRMHAESKYASKTAQGQHLIDKFLQRTIAYTRQMETVIRERALLSVRVGESDTTEMIAQKCLEAIAGK